MIGAHPITLERGGAYAVAFAGDTVVILVAPSTPGVAPVPLTLTIEEARGLADVLGTACESLNVMRPREPRRG